jgi:SDR family mycofactocin-dependent oxidoreductase
MSEAFQLPGLEGKVAFVTGAGHGMGRSHAVRMAQSGVDSILVDVGRDIDEVPYAMATAAELEETVTLVEAEGARAHAALADVRDLTALQDAVAAGVERFGGVDIVVANAGVVVQEQGVSGWEVSEARFRAVVEVNLFGVWNTLKATVPALLERGGGGSIVLVSSTAGLKGMIDIPDYAASKHGVVGLMRTFAQELAPHRIRVNTVHPTGVATPMTESEMMTSKFAASPALMENFANLLPVDALQPTDLSDAVLWLASDAAQYITGVTLPVDAGYTAK